MLTMTGWAIFEGCKDANCAMSCRTQAQNGRETARHHARDAQDNAFDSLLIPMSLCAGIMSYSQDFWPGPGPG